MKFRLVFENAAGHEITPGGLIPQIIVSNIPTATFADKNSIS